MDKETKRLRHNGYVNKYYHTPKGKKKILEAQARWRKKHKEQFNAYQREYQSKEKYKAKRRLYMIEYKRRKKLAKAK